MPKPRFAKLETPTARHKLAVRKRPYWAKVGPGTWLGYRRNQTGGTWSARVGSEDGKGWEKRIALADDLEPARPPLVIGYWQALAEVQKLGRQHPGVDEDDPTKPVTVDEALRRYEADLRARGAAIYNARRPRVHLSSALLCKPVKLIHAAELERWRNGLVAAGKLPASINRTINNLRAALELACPERSPIWKKGLQTLPNADRSRNKLFVLPDDTIRALVSAAYRHDEKLGELCDVLAQTGTRPVQAARLRVGCLVAHAVTPKLMMSKSAKGGGRNRVEKKRERYPLPITATLALKLKKAATGRSDEEALLLQSNGRPWSEKNAHGDYRQDFAAIVKALGLNKKITAYVFRHSSITRQLLRGLPTRVVAANHNTSVKEIERTYSKFITDHSDELTRGVLLEDAPASAAGNIIPLAR